MQEPTASEPLAIARELLAPHGLTLRGAATCRSGTRSNVAAGEVAPLTIALAATTPQLEEIMVNDKPPQPHPYTLETPGTTAGTAKTGENCYRGTR